MKKFFLSLVSISALCLSSCVEENYEADRNDTLAWGKRHAYEMVDAWASHVNQILLCDFNSAVSLDELIPSMVGAEVGSCSYFSDSTVIVKYMGENHYRAAMVNDVYMTCIETDGNRLSDPQSSWRVYSACNEDFTSGFIGIYPRNCNYCPRAGYNFPMVVAGNGDSWTVTETKKGKVKRQGVFVVKLADSADGARRFIVNCKGQFPVMDYYFIYDYDVDSAVWAEYDVKDLIWTRVNDTWQYNMIGGSADIEIFSSRAPFTLKPFVSFGDGKIYIRYEDMVQTYYPSERP